MTTTKSFAEDVTRVAGGDLDAEIARAVWLRSVAAGEAQKTDKSSTPDVSSHVERIAAADIKELSAVVLQLIALWKSPVSDHRGKLRPDAAAFEWAIQLLVDASITLKIDHKRPVPYGCVSPDFEGGIRVEWVRDLCGVHLVIPADATETYLYHEEQDAYGTDDNVTAEGLASRLQMIED